MAHRPLAVVCAQGIGQVDQKPKWVAHLKTHGLPQKRRSSSANHSTVGPQGPQAQAAEGQHPRAEGFPSASRRMHPRLHHNPLEAELGAA